MAFFVPEFSLHVPSKNGLVSLFYITSRGGKSILDKFELSKIAYPPIGLARISATVPLVNYFLIFYHPKSSVKFENGM